MKLLRVLLILWALGATALIPIAAVTAHTNSSSSSSSHQTQPLAGLDYRTTLAGAERAIPDFESDVADKYGDVGPSYGNEGDQRAGGDLDPDITIDQTGKTGVHEASCRAGNPKPGTSPVLNFCLKLPITGSPSAQVTAWAQQFFAHATDGENADKDFPGASWYLSARTDKYPGGTTLQYEVSVGPSYT